MITKKTVKAIDVDGVMKNAHEYDENPATFSRATIVNDTVYVSGTASIGSNGETLHIGDFNRQTIQTFENLTSVLKEAGCDWKNVVRTTIYLRDIDRDYENFNEIRKLFYKNVGILKYPASTCIGAKICRSNLLIEIELIAVRNSEIV
jgi:reactive intermediate/imine deaminase